MVATQSSAIRGLPFPDVAIWSNVAAAGGGDAVVVVVAVEKSALTDSDRQSSSHQRDVRSGRSLRIAVRDSRRQDSWCAKIGR